jgi:hypothetical protein
VPSATESKPAAKTSEESARPEPRESATRRTISESRVRVAALVLNWSIRNRERSSTLRKLRSLSSQGVFWVMSSTLTP